MQTGLTLEAAAVELDRQKSAKRDFVAPAGRIEFVPEDVGESRLPHISLGGEDRYTIGDVAQSHIADFSKVPKKYLDVLYAEAPDLYCKNVNHWFGVNAPARRLVRTLDGRVRALLSDAFRPLDNYDLAEAVFPRLAAGDLQLKSIQITERRLYIQAVKGDLRADITPGNHTPISEEEALAQDLVQPMITISNSEVGYGQVAVEGGLFRLVCVNGLIVPSAAVKKRHIGQRLGNGLGSGVNEFIRDETRLLDDAAVFAKVRDTVDGILSEEGFDKIVELHRAAQGDAIEGDLPEVVEVASRELGLTEAEGRGVLTSLSLGGNLTRFGLIQAITAQAHEEVAIGDRSIELQRLGGQVLELPKGSWKRIADAAFSEN